MDFTDRHSVNFALSRPHRLLPVQKNKLGHYRIMNVLVIDIGGTNVKILATEQTAMAERVKQAASDLRASGKTIFGS
jgi:hypothetical protein